MHCSNAKIKTSQFWFPDSTMSSSGLPAPPSAFQPPPCKLKDWMAQSALFLTQPCKIDHISPTHIFPENWLRWGDFWQCLPLVKQGWGWGGVGGRKGNSDSHSVPLNYLAPRAGNSSKVSAAKKFSGGGAGEPSQRGTPATWKDGVCSRLDSKKQRGCQTKRELYNMYILSFKTFGRARYIIILKAAQAGVSFCLEWVLRHFHECIDCASKSLLYKLSWAVSY